ncbi:MAG: SPFH domain-containing protein [Oscillospiraceae bacterium]|nr:SPFH domain-containing protein [Oscillospiraceae bacterium]
MPDSITQWMMIGGIVAIIILFVGFLWVVSRYRKCPSDKILVKYGKVGKDKDGQSRSAMCIHGGAAFIWPVIQSFQYMDLTPISINVDLRNALSKQNIRVNVPSRFTVGISVEPGVMQNAAERLLGLKMSEIQDLASDIILGQLRLVIATMDIEEINSNRDKFLAEISSNVEGELKKIGLRLINVNVTDISDAAGYIEALGKEAAAKAINDAKKMVAEKDRDGSIGEAEAQRDQRVQVASANATAIEGENAARIEIARSEALRDQKEVEAKAQAENAAKKAVAETHRDGEIGQAQALRDQRIQVAAANATAIEGENSAKVLVSQSEALRREKEAEALKIATAAEKVQAAKALEESYTAQKAMELARAEMERATQQADVIVKAEIERQQSVIAAQAQAEVIRQQAKGEADAIFAKMEAQANGAKEILTKQADGMRDLVNAAGNAEDAVKLIVADKLEELMRVQVDAIKNIKIDKVTVWDSGTNAADGKNSTANFISGMMKSVPPLGEVFKQAGMDLPKFLGEESLGSFDAHEYMETLENDSEEKIENQVIKENAE